jgi:hypothetical protein
MLRRIGIISVLSLIAVALTATVAFAAKPTTPTEGVHFTQGGEPVCTITGATVDCSAELAGLGQGDIVSSTSVSGFAVYTCVNKGENPAPGQNKVLEGPDTNDVIIPGGDIKNGRVTIPGTSTLEADETVSGAAAGCPNKNWQGVDPQLTITSVTFSASQGGVLLFTSTATNSNGLPAPSSPLSPVERPPEQDQHVHHARGVHVLRVGIKKGRSYYTPALSFPYSPEFVE